MEPRDVIMYLISIKCETEDEYEHRNAAIGYILKDIPKEAVDIGTLNDRTLYGKCPICSNNVNSESKRCDECGQILIFNPDVRPARNDKKE